MPTVTNTIAGALSNPGLTQGSLDASTDTTYSLSFAPANEIPSAGVIEVVYPNAITVTNPVTCTNVLSVTGVSCSIDTVARKITASGWSTAISAGTGLQFTFATVTNPATATTENLQVCTYTDSTTTYIIDQDLTSLTPSLQCNYPCLTCPDNDKNFCQSCLDTGSLQYLYNNGCVASCPDGWINKGTKTCS